MERTKKATRIVTIVLAICLLLAAAAGLTVFAVNSSISAKAVDTAYTGNSDQQYVIRFKEPTGVTFSLEKRKKSPFNGYLGKEVGNTLKDQYGILDIKKFETDVPQTETWYDVALDKDTIASKDNYFDFYCAYDANSISSIDMSYVADGTSSEFGEDNGAYYIEMTDWANGTTDGHLPVVTVTAVRKTVTYAVTHNNGDGFTFTGNGKAIAGENYNFTVVVHDGYSITSVKYTVNEENEKNALGSNGSYVIPAADVTGAIQITIEVKPASYLVTFNTPANAVFSVSQDGNSPLVSQSVTHNGSLDFYLVANVGYTVENAKVYHNGSELSSSEDGEGGAYKKFTLSNVTAPETVTASGVTQKTYAVTQATEAENGFEITGLPTGQVTYGSSVTFTVNVTAEGKEIDKVSYTMDGTDDEKVLTSPNNTYTIPSVTGNVTIKVTLKDTQYSITFPAKNSQIGYTITKDGKEGTQLAGLVTKKYGDLKFNISLKPGYTGEPEVTFVPTSGQAQSLSKADGVYTLKVTSNGTINVDGITQETYTVTVNTEKLTHYHYTPSGSTTNLTYGSTFHFTVEADNGYSFDGYTIVAKKGEDFVVVTPTAGNKQKTNFSFTVEGNVSVTITENDDAAQTFTVSSDSSNTHCTIKVGENVLGTEDNDKVKFNSQFSFTVEADKGYTVTGVYVGNSSVPSRNDTYTITVTGDVAIHVALQENTLTVTYMNSSGEPSSPQNYTYTQLVSGVQVPDADTYAQGGTFTYLLASWYKDGKPYTDQKFKEELIAGASASITLNCRYAFNTAKSGDLFKSFTATYRDDNESTDGWDSNKSYVVVKLGIDSAKWKDFLNELNTLNASLTAVGFTYSNAPQGVLNYTNEEISGKITGMALATGDGIGRVNDADKNGSDGAVSRLYGYRWDGSSLTQENQVQFIKGINSGVKRYVGGWFAITINGVRTVIQSDLEVVAGIPEQKKTAVEAVLTESAPTYESDEEPTIE